MTSLLNIACQSEPYTWLQLSRGLVKNNVLLGLPASQELYVGDDGVISDSDDSTDIENWTEVSRKNSYKRKTFFSPMNDSLLPSKKRILKNNYLCNSELELVKQAHNHIAPVIILFRKVQARGSSWYSDLRVKFTN